MTLKEEVYHAVHNYIKVRVEQLNEALENNDPESERLQIGLIELMKVQRLIYKKFADYNEKLAKESRL